MKTYPIHPICGLFPEIEGEELQQLVDDIRENGLLQPIVLHQETVIDGRNRQKACELAKVEPQFVEWNGIGSLSAWVVSQNLRRRHLDASQRAVVAAKLIPFLEAENRTQANAARRESAQQRPRSSDGGFIPAGQDESRAKITHDSSPPVPPSREVNQHRQSEAKRSVMQAAKAAGANTGYVKEIRKLENEHEDLAEAVKTEKMSIPQAQRERVRREKAAISPVYEAIQAVAAAGLDKAEQWEDELNAMLVSAIEQRDALTVHLQRMTDAAERAEAKSNGSFTDLQALLAKAPEAEVHKSISEVRSRLERLWDRRNETQALIDQLLELAP